MTPFDGLLNGYDIKREPTIWVQKLVVYRDISTPPIQTIEFRKGMNIIRAGDDSVRDEITGHGTGKTTLCRFIRYVLGEQTYSNKNDRNLIKAVFKNGCVAAEIYILGKRFVVRRPFDDTASYILENGSIEDIISSPPEAIPKNQYIDRLNLHSLCDSLSFRSGRKVQWGHLLAWMTRDQESRLSSIYDWRNSESDSASPVFQNSKSDPLFLMRAILNLLAPDEVLNEKELQRLEIDIDKQTKEIDALRNAPLLNIKKSEEELRNALKEAGTVFDGSIGLMWEKSEGLIDDSLATLSSENQETLKTEIDNQKTEKKKTSDEIESLVKNIGAKEMVLAQAKTVKTLLLRAKENSLPKKPNEGSLDRMTKTEDVQKQEDNASFIGEIECEYGRRLVKDCTHFISLLPEASENTVIPQEKKQSVNSILDSHVLDQNAAKFENDIELQEQRIERIVDEIRQLKEQKSTKGEEHTQADEKIRKKENLLNSIQRLRGHVVYWHKKLKENKELLAAETILQLMQKRQRELNESLDSLLENHRQNTNIFTDVFDKTVRSILRDTKYSGRVSLKSDRELAFDIFYGQSPSKSVAINVLKTILADISAMVYSAMMEHVIFPRLLVHDSPREADLQIVHYNRIFEMLVIIQSEFEKTGNCPFQYIITTTTEPTNVDAKFFPMPVLDARNPEKMFLKCRLEEEIKKIKEATPLIDNAE